MTWQEVDESFILNNGMLLCFCLYLVIFLIFSAVNFFLILRNCGEEDRAMQKRGL